MPRTARRFVRAATAVRVLVTDSPRSIAIGLRSWQRDFLAQYAAGRRCDFLLVATLGAAKTAELNRALGRALELEGSR